MAIKCDLAPDNKGWETDFDVGERRRFDSNRFWSYRNYRDAPIPVAAKLQEAAGTVMSRWEIDMGKYFVAWLLGVPAVVLVIVYVFFH